MTSLVEAKKALGPKQRVGFIIPKRILDELEKITSNRGRSQFVSSALAKSIDEIKKSEKLKELAKKYEDFSKESKEIAKDWHGLDLSDWDEI